MMREPQARRLTMPKKYQVALTPEQRDALTAVTRSGTHPARKVIRARVLLKADEGLDDAAVATACDCSRTTVEQVRRRFAADGLAAVDRRPQPPRPGKRSLDGAAEARLTALACSAPPDGRSSWSMQLLADRMVELRYIEEPVSDETVRRAVKKTRSSRG
jgi:transposase